MKPPVYPLSQIIIHLPARPRDIPLAPKRRHRIALIHQPGELAHGTDIADAHAGPDGHGGPDDDAALVAVVDGEEAVGGAEVAEVAAAFDGGALGGVEVVALVGGVFGEGGADVESAEGDGRDAGCKGGCAGCEGRLVGGLGAFFPSGDLR